MPLLKKLQEGRKGFAVLMELLKLSTISTSVEGYENLTSETSHIELPQDKIELYNENIDKLRLALMDLVSIFLDNVKSKKNKLPNKYENEETLEVLWRSSFSPRKDKKFDITDLTCQALELATQFSADDLLINLKKIWKDFSSSQKGYYLLILWQLEALAIMPSAEIREGMLDLAKEAKDAHKSITPDFYQALEKKLPYEQLYLPEIKQKLEQTIPFEDLVNTAIQLEEENIDNSEEIKKIAADLQLLTIQFYQSLGIQELNKDNLESKSKTVNPNLTMIVQHYNKLSSYFTSLALKDKKIKKTEQVLKFLIKLAQQLCTPNYPDLNHLNLIGSIFLKDAIFRLIKNDSTPTIVITDESDKTKTVLIEFDSQTNQQLKELLALISLEEGNEAFYQFLERNKSAMYFTGALKNNLIFYPAISKVKKLKESDRTKGSLLLQIWPRKILTLMTQSIFQTNLGSFLNHFQSSEEANFQRWSFEMNPSRRRSVPRPLNNLIATSSSAPVSPSSSLELGPIQEFSSAPPTLQQLSPPETSQSGDSPSSRELHSVFKQKPKEEESEDDSIDLTADPGN